MKIKAIGIHKNSHKNAYSGPRNSTEVLELDSDTVDKELAEKINQFNGGILLTLDGKTFIVEKSETSKKVPFHKIEITFHPYLQYL